MPPRAPAPRAPAQSPILAPSHEDMAGGLRPESQLHSSLCGLFANSVPLGLRPGGQGCLTTLVGGAGRPWH